jgi:predicted DNA-binding protein with PD1-like motif
MRGESSLVLIFGLFLVALSKNTQTKLMQSYAQTYSVRLHPNQDIMASLLSLAKSSHLKAVSIMSAVGSVLHCSLRFANNSYLTRIEGPLEIVSLSGTIDKNQMPHIHASLANQNGAVVGGHLPSL